MLEQGFPIWHYRSRSVIASVQPPLGLKRTFAGASLRTRSAEWVGEQTTNAARTMDSAERILLVFRRPS